MRDDPTEDEDEDEEEEEAALCDCSGCDCAEEATTTDDGGEPVCDECAEFAVDDDGEVHCMRMGDVETVTEGGNTPHSYTRLIPPEMPDSDSDGEWCT